MEIEIKGYSKKRNIKLELVKGYGRINLRAYKGKEYQNILKIFDDGVVSVCKDNVKEAFN